MLTDLTWLTAEAKGIHNLFSSIYYSLITVLLLLGVFLEYFKFPMGNIPNFTTLVGRAIIATILLISYPEISNTITGLSDALSQSIGGLNNIKLVTEKTADTLSEYTWSWTSLGDTFIWIIGYLAYFLLYITVFIFEAATLYGITILYIFSPILIALFILPGTARATGVLFRSLFEISAWKIVWCVTASLLWSTALSNLGGAEKPNFIVTISYIVILSLSLLFTPKLVRALMDTGISSMSGTMAGLGAATFSAGLLGPSGLAKVMKSPITAPHTAYRKFQSYRKKNTKSTMSQPNLNYSTKSKYNKPPDDKQLSFNEPKIKRKSYKPSDDKLIKNFKS